MIIVIPLPRSPFFLNVFHWQYSCQLSCEGTLQSSILNLILINVSWLYTTFSVIKTESELSFSLSRAGQRKTWTWINRYEGFHVTLCTPLYDLSNCNVLFLSSQIYIWKNLNEERASIPLSKHSNFSSTFCGSKKIQYLRKTT